MLDGARRYTSTSTSTSTSTTNATATTTDADAGIDKPGALLHTCLVSDTPAAVPLQCGRCLVRPPPLERCIPALDYAFPWDHWLQALKFRSRLEVLPVLGELLGRAVGDQHPDLVLPVPLSAERLRERGFNQSLEIARHLPARRQYRLCAHTLIRVRHTGRQSELPLADRRSNLRGAFAVVRPVRGLRVALVDDVMTSGATLHEAAHTLLRAGAVAVQAWVVARTP